MIKLQENIVLNLNVKDGFFASIFQILDLAEINAWVLLYKETTGEKISRFDFLLKLAEELVVDHKEEKS